MRLLLVSFFAICSLETAKAEFNDIVFIVNAQNPVEKISLTALREYYLKVVPTWPDGSSVRFIDRDSSSSLRKKFLAKVVKKTPVDVDLYWIGQQIHTGNSAPLQEKTEFMTIEFVSTFKGAIGYISKDTPIKSKNVKVLKVE